ncbi:hypothetical protein CEUSTIGMA_g12192.t1 [Chlamydomonas eustigma]|uniref:Patatin n=1 Tax=Chlamydomonas eustigma TaxID=1157962 RepID=A0A250XPP9_9CHLO|nr:hypothetical protein CEUSTIGMA_g12192.t1 [Chlamydomonas eustigma]|eukprot:GAX84770.1 hypothetical protein CEUSTIGMA_g12192.t1 [Chlamydomonas eustigma]
MDDDALSTIVFPGGGTNGVSLIGCLAAIERLQPLLLRKVTRVLGFSSGAIVALLFAAGLNSDEMVAWIRLCVASRSVTDVDLMGLLNFDERLGLDDASRFVAALEALLTSRGYSASITLAQLLRLTGVALEVVVTDLTRMRPELLSPVSAPDMPAVKAVRMSIAVPMLLTPVTHDGRLYVDGSIFEGILPNPSGKKIVFRYVDLPDSNSNGDVEVKTLIDFTTLLAQCLMTRWRMGSSSSSDAADELVIPVPWLWCSIDVASLTLQLDDEVIDAHLANGCAAATNAMMSPLTHFLAAFRVEKGEEHTHTSMSRPGGSYYVPSCSSDAFMQEYRAALKRGETLHLTERHRHIGPVVVDLDFRYSVPDAATPVRRYDDSIVERIVHAYARGVRDLLMVSAPFDVYVTERDGPTAGARGKVKDGLHLIMPDIVTRPAIQRLLRKDVLERRDLERALAPMGLENGMDNVVDDAVIDRNNWMMYGSVKPGMGPYRLTRVFRCDVDGHVTRRVFGEKARGNAGLEGAMGGLEGAMGGLEGAMGGLEGATMEGSKGGLEGGSDGEGPDLVSLFSIRNKQVQTSVRPDQRERVQQFVNRLDEEHRRKEAVQDLLSASSDSDGTPTCENLELVTRLASLLSAKRVESYAEWVRLGWCLRNIDHRLLDAWTALSKTSEKYVEGECARLWRGMRLGGLGIGTLHMWARADDPEGYRAALRQDLHTLIKDAKENASHHDVARVVQHLYRYDYVCSSIRHRTWWEFRQHRWHECDSGHSLRKRLSTEVWDEIAAAKRAFQDGWRHTDDDDKQKRDTEKRFTDLMMKLKISKFKDDVMKECAELFYVERFEDRLDSSLHLLCFENGVYDLEQLEFRDGRPDDCVSFTTGINYVPFSEDHPTVQEIMRFWECVHPRQDIRDYVLLTLSSCLSGKIREERFHIWTGSGSNGKSLSVSLFEKALGQYCCKFPVTLLTQKRTASSSATPEIARAKGRRFAVLQEPSNDERLNVGQLKELSGGDTVQTRELFKSPCEWRPQFKLFLLCNQLPNVPSDDGGTWRRIRVVEFGSKFVHRPERANEFPIDMELSKKIDGWKEHFMALLIDYYKRYVSTPLHEPDAVVECTREYQRTNDHMADFLDTCLVVGCPNNVTVTMDEVFSEFKEWVREDQVPLRSVKKSELRKYLERAIGNVPERGMMCMYSAEGTYACPNSSTISNACPTNPTYTPPSTLDVPKAPWGVNGAVEPFGAPAYVDAAAKKDAWAQRSAGGYPLPATEREARIREKPGWVQGAR